MSKSNHKKTLQTKEIALLGMMTATLVVAKFAFQIIPNLELVTFLIIIFAYNFGYKVIFATFAFTFLQIFQWGFNTWVAMYIYIWPLLVIIVCLMRKWADICFFTFLTIIWGFCFGAMCSVVYVFIGGINYAISWWITGITYDLMHGVFNGVVMLVLYYPVNNAVKIVAKQYNNC